MSANYPASLGLRVRRANGRFVISVSSDRPEQKSGLHALFLFFSRDIPEETKANRAGISQARTECGLLVEPSREGTEKPAIAVTTRHPDLEDPTGTIVWNGPPPGAAGIEALFVPLFSDLIDLAARMDLGQDTPVAVAGGGLPLPLIAGPLGLQGGKVVPAGSPGTTERVERRHLLYRPAPGTIEKYLSGVQDGSLIAIYSPEAGDSVYDFYPHVHRRGLHIIHGAAGDGRLLNDAEWRTARGAMHEVSVPVVRMPEGSAGGASQPLDLPPETEAFILQMTV